MGIRKWFSSTGNCIGADVSSKKKNKIDYSFKLLDFVFKNGYSYVVVNYPHCDHLEGKKILVFRGNVRQKLKLVKEIDPHFGKENKCGLDLVARISPEEMGMEFIKKVIDNEI